MGYKHALHNHPFRNYFIFINYFIRFYHIHKQADKNISITVKILS